MPDLAVGAADSDQAHDLELASRETHVFGVGGCPDAEAATDRFAEE